MPFQYRKEKDKTVLQHCIAQRKKKYNVRNVNIGNTPKAELYMHCCVGNYSAVFLHLLMFLSVGPQILIHITTDIFPCNAAWKDSFGMSYPASAGVCWDVLTCCIHGSQGHLSMWLVIINLPPPC